MSYKVILKPKFEADIKEHLKSGNKKLVLKVAQFLDELSKHPRSGTGKPEQLKGNTEEIWSRRIDSKHRLLYKIYNEELIVVAISAYGHYGDK
ncbi:MAG: Txe/YoeB family addiction module toxin [Rikenellaceae bacterium]